MRHFQEGFWLGFSIQVYQRLLITLPNEFRQDYAQDMAQVFRDCCRHAYRCGGSMGVLSELVAGTFDLLINAARERITAFFRDDRRVLTLTAISLIAVIGGVYAALADLQNEEWPGPLYMVVIFTFALGFLRPSNFWLTGLLVGAMLPVMHFISHANSWELYHSPDDPTAISGFLALIPALMGSIFGAVFRLVMNRLSTRFQ